MDFKIKVKEAFDQISEIYDQVRRLPWKDLIEFIEKYNFLDDCDILLDIACGNARHTEIMADQSNFSIGLELSNELLKIARKNCQKPNIFLINSDAVHLPFRDNLFSKIIYIAALHHVSSEIERLKSLLELRRVLSPAGKAIITVWRRYQDRFFFIFFIDLIFMNFIKRNLEFGDIFVPWRGPDQKIIANRFYHLFTMSEFKKILKKAGLNVLECKYFSGKSKTENLITLVKK